MFKNKLKLIGISCLNLLLLVSCDSNNVTVKEFENQLKEFSFAVFTNESGVNNETIKEILKIYKDYIINKHKIEEEIIGFKAYLE